MACWRCGADPQVPPIHQEVDAVFLRRDREVLRRAHDFEAGRRRSRSRRARASARSVPVHDDRGFLREVVGRWNVSSPTAAFDITAWMNPDPSRTCRKWILPLDGDWPASP